MLTKLMKHEFIATGRVMLPLYLLLVVVSVGVNLSVHGMVMSPNPLFSLLGTLFLISYVIILAAAAILCLVVIVTRFYRNMMGAEGYLTLTLPVSVHQHVLSKLAISLVWMLLTGIAVMLSVLLLFLGVELPVGQLFDVIRTSVSSLDLHFGKMMSVGLLLSLMEIALFILQVYASCAIGGSFANNKLVLSITSFFAIQITVNALNNLLNEAGMSMLYESLSNANLMVNSSLALRAVITGIEILLFYFITTYFLKNKLNLE